MSTEDELSELRARIDEIDARLLALINERAALAQQAGRVKQRSGATDDHYRPEREAQVLRRARAAGAGSLPADEAARLIREIMSACLALEQRLRVAYLGPAGTFTEAAALKHFGRSVEAVPAGAIEEVFQAVEAEHCDVGVVPLENSIEGSVNQTLDRFVVTPLKICGEVELPIHHFLLSRAADLAGVRRVYAHPQSFAQCRHWLDAHLGGIERMPVASNAEAARRAGAEEGAAAIAGDQAGRLYELRQLAARIEDHPGNTTRFAVIGRRPVPPSGDDKTSLLFSVANRPGALYHALKAFADAEISMSRIESRPSRRGAWEYDFFVDVEGHAEEPRVAAALEALRSRAATLKLLGSYPRAAI
jgi:chorismate mutase/prephenate dehydratase